MTPKRQKKYLTRDMILKDIDKAHRKIKQAEVEAGLTDALILFFRDTGNRAKLEEHQGISDRLWKKINRLKNTRLKKLGMTLAAFDTAPMPGVVDSEQVVLEKV